MQKLNITQPFLTELGYEFPSLEIGYHTYGKLNAQKDNVVWVCHALTANSDPMDWWPGLFGQEKCFDPNRYFIVCANILGSCYGSTGPESINPDTNTPFYYHFPRLTVRDWVQAHELLREHLGINQIAVGIGGSIGGYQLIEWAIMHPERLKNMVLIATGVHESGWGIAIHSTQRMAIETDATWGQSHPSAGINGLKTARAIGMLTYRNYEIFCSKQQDNDGRLDHFSATSYLKHQGNKLAERFSAHAYWHLSKIIDTHHIARGRGSVADALSAITAQTLAIGIKSDILCPPAEQKIIAHGVKDSQYALIDSPYGHDGFLIEFEQISAHINQFLIR